MFFSDNQPENVFIFPSPFPKPEIQIFSSWNVELSHLSQIQTLKNISSAPVFIEVSGSFATDFSRSRTESQNGVHH